MEEIIEKTKEKKKREEQKKESSKEKFFQPSMRYERKIPSKKVLTSIPITRTVGMYGARLNEKKTSDIQARRKEIEYNEIPIIKSVNFYKTELKRGSEKSLVQVVPKVKLPSPVEVAHREKYKALIVLPREKTEIERGRSEVTITEIPQIPLSTIYETGLLEKRKSMLKEREMGIKAKTIVGESISGGKEPENIVEKLFPHLSGTGILDWDIYRPIIVFIKEKDGRKMLEDLISKKYCFQGFYRFAKELPWGGAELKEVYVRSGRGATVLLHKIKQITSSSVKSDALIVSGALAENKKEAEDIINSIKEISEKGNKCIILHVKEGLEEIENRVRKIHNVDVCIIGLPERNEETKALMAEMMGISPDSIVGKTVDDYWYDAIKVLERKEKECDELPERIGDVKIKFYPERETTRHYVMKKLVCHWIKREFSNKKIEVEEPIRVTEEGKIEKVIPDITCHWSEGSEMKKEYWEVETGYPSEAEKGVIIDWFDPRARLVWKLRKYLEFGCVEERSRVNVVLPSVYVYLFKKALRKVKRQFKGEIDLKFYTIDWTKGIIKGLW